MDWIRFIILVVAGLVSMVFMNFVNVSRERRLQILDNGYNTMRHSKIYLIVGSASLITGLGFLIGCFFSEVEGDLFIGVVMLVLLGGIGLYLLIYYFWKVKYNEEHIIVENWRGKVECIAWTEINEITCNRFLGHMKLIGADKTVRIPIALVGILPFFYKIEEKTSVNIRDLKLPLE